MTKKLLLIYFLLIGSVNNVLSQETFILNYEDVDIKKLHKILLSSQKNDYPRPKGER